MNFRNFVDEKIPFRQSDREDQSHDVAVQCFLIEKMDRLNRTLEELNRTLNNKTL